MAEESFEERTEAPTDKRRQEAREKGNVAKSAEINSTLVLLTGVMMLYWFAPWMFRQLSGFMRSMLGLISHPHADISFVAELTTQSLVFIFYICLPVCAAIMIVGIAANLLQVGFMFTLQPLAPKLEKLNLLSGAKRLLSLRSIVEMVKDIAKLLLIGAIAFFTIKGEFGILMVSFKIVLRVALALLIISIIDFFYQRYEYEKQLKMTKQEVKEERKQMDGDPQIKSRVRSLQREMARRRMMQEVPKATVVVTNPTYIAIAIRYEPEAMQTPKVMAKGKRLMAGQIKKKAMELGIPIVEDKPLARAMYDKVEPGDDIPVEFFAAVAEVLAYVYRLKKKEAA
jgi:flagellar biosynthetic protein FlhB